MTKRAHVKRQKYSSEHDGHSYSDNKFNDSKRSKERGRGKRRQYEDNSNIVDISSRSAQLATAYSPHRTKSPLTARTPA